MTRHTSPAGGGIWPSKEISAPGCGWLRRLCFSGPEARVSRVTAATVRDRSRSCADDARSRAARMRRARTEDLDLRARRRRVGVRCARPPVGGGRAHPGAEPARIACAGPLLLALRGGPELESRSKGCAYGGHAAGKTRRVRRAGCWQLPLSHSPAPARKSARRLAPATTAAEKWRGFDACPSQGKCRR